MASPRNRRAQDEIVPRDGSSIELAEAQSALLDIHRSGSPCPSDDRSNRVQCTRGRVLSCRWCSSNDSHPVQEGSGWTVVQADVCCRSKHHPTPVELVPACEILVLNSLRRIFSQQSVICRQRRTVENVIRRSRRDVQRRLTTRRTPEDDLEVGREKCDRVVERLRLLPSVL